MSTCPFWSTGLLTVPHALWRGNGGGRVHLGALLVGLPSFLIPNPVPTTAQDAAALDGIHTIQHVVVIMQENRSFDHYFGTFPGANGIPMQNGVPSVCVPDPKTNQCVAPFHDGQDKNAGGPHSEKNATADINGGKMDGFVKEAQGGLKNCANPNDPACTNGDRTDVMGYKDARDIPNYWQYAQQFVLQDAMFEDDFLGGQRIDPANDGRPDPRPTVRENVPQLGDLTQDFDFTQDPRPPLILPPNPPPGPASVG